MVLYNLKQLEEQFSCDRCTYALNRNLRDITEELDVQMTPRSPPPPPPPNEFPLHWVQCLSAQTIHSSPLTQPAISAPYFIENSDPYIMAGITYGLHISHFKFPPEHKRTS